MPSYYKKTWWTGDSKWDPTNEPLEEQWPKPLFRPSWWISYTQITANGPKNRKGRILYAHRRHIDTLTCYMVTRPNGDHDIVVETQVKERIEPQEMKDFE